MNRILASLSIGVLLTASAAAQCLTGLGAATATGVVGDDTIGTTHYALGFTYATPLGGATPAGGFTHVKVCSNGWLMLTNGSLTTGQPGTSSYGSTSNTASGLGGGAGSFPLIAPYWGDGNIVTTGNIYFLAGGPGVPAEITWFDHSDFGSTTIKKTVKVKIFDDAVGTIKFEYGTPFANNGTGSVRYVGVSTRNGIATVPPQTNLGLPGATSGTSGMCFKTFPTGAMNLADHTISFAQNGLGGWDVMNMCGTPFYPPPLSTVVGTGCYSIPAINNVVYQQWTSATPVTAMSLASPDLTGNAMTCTNIGTGYLMTWVSGGATSGPTTYVPPGTAGGTLTSLTTTDDGSHLVATGAIASPQGPFTSVVVSHNGVVTLGGTANTTSFTVSGAAFATHSANPGFYFWNDFNDTEAGSGVIKVEENATTIYITWDGVESYQFPAVADPSTFQFQIDKASGNVSIVWLSVTTIGYDIRNCIVGFHGKTASADPGSVVLSTALPIVQTKSVLPMTMSIDSLPIITLPSGDTVPMKWTVTNVPEATQLGVNVRACQIVFSIAPAFVAGVDLGFINNPPNPGANGCRGYITSADAFLGIADINATGICSSLPLVFSPPPSLIGLVLTTQAIAIAPPGVYGGFANDIDGINSLWTSNAIEQTYNPL